MLEIACSGISRAKYIIGITLLAGGLLEPLALLKLMITIFYILVVGSQLIYLLVKFLFSLIMNRPLMIRPDAHKAKVIHNIKINRL